MCNLNKLKRQRIILQEMYNPLCYENEDRADNDRAIEYFFKRFDELIKEHECYAKQFKKQLRELRIKKSYPQLKKGRRKIANITHLTNITRVLY